MISEIKEFELTCDSCGKKTIFKSASHYDLPTGWHREDPKSTFFGFVDGYTNIQSIMDYSTEKHYCEDCYTIKDIIE